MHKRPCSLFLTMCRACVFESTATSSLDGKSDSYNYLILEVLDDVRCELRFWRYSRGLSGGESCHRLHAHALA